jgi:selenocysteine lyase/cysteine desulfurase
MRRSSALFTGAFAVALAIVTTAPPAQAALWLELRPAAASPGEVVHGRTGGQAAMAGSPGVRLPLVLVKAERAGRLPPKVSSSAALRMLPGVVPVGTLEVDRRGDGTITFTVPNVPPGRYATVLWCPGCARYSFGANVVHTGVLTVTGGRLPSTGRAVAWQVAVALVLLLVGAGLLALGYAHRRMDPTTGPAARRPLPVQRELFDIPDDVAYFNCASLAPQLRSAREAAESAWRRCAQPWLIRADDWFTEAEERRALFARLAGVDADGVALVPATSYGLAVAAANLTAAPGQRVLVLAEDYPSNYYTWQRFARRTGATLAAVARTDGQTWAEALLEALDERTAVVAVLAVHWTDGALVDLDAVAARARAVGAAVVVDASQALGAMPLDLAAARPDFLVSVGYKWLLGPFGLGYLYVAPQHRDGVPLEENWISRLGSQDFTRLVDFQDRYQPGARRFDVGQRTHFETTPMAIAALRQLLDWEVPRVAATLRQTTDRIEEQVRALGLGLTSPDRGPHLLGILLPAPARRRVAAALTRAGVFAGLRGSSLRVSPHLWTTGEDVGRLVVALANALEGD